MKWGSALVCPSHHLWGEGVLRVLPRDRLGEGGEGERRGSIPELPRWQILPAPSSRPGFPCSGLLLWSPSLCSQPQWVREKAGSSGTAVSQARTGPEQNSGRPWAVPTSVAWLLRGGEGCPWRQRERGPFHPP